MVQLTPNPIDQVRTFLRVGSGEQALACLEQVLMQECQKSFSPTSEAFYLQIWAQSAYGQYESAANLLLPTVNAEQESELAEALRGSALRRKAPVLLLLGSLALQWGAESEALMHYSECISALNERRMNLPLMRIKALCGCGSIHIRQKVFAEALDMYTMARQLCGDGQAHPALLDCVLGLCEASLRLGSYRQAPLWGTQALPLAGDRGDELAQVSILSWLGEAQAQQEDLASALAYYQDACRVAQTLSRADLAAALYGKIATLKFRHKRYAEAREVCYLGLELAREVHAVEPSQKGVLMGIVGNCFQKEISLYEPGSVLWQVTVQNAFTWYHEARDVFKECRALALLADIYQRLATLALETGTPGEASDYLKQALAVLPMEAL